MEQNIDLSQNGEIILYQPDNRIRLEVRMEEETVWLTQAQMAMLFACSQYNIGLQPVDFLWPDVNFTCCII